MSRRQVGERTRCQSCNAPIFWLETINGKLMPIDTRPEQRTVIVLADDTLILAGKGDGGEFVRARVVPTYTSHFATCPEAEKWRRR